MTVSRFVRPVVYKGCTINVEKKGESKYTYTVVRSITFDLFGIADTLEKAFEEARNMIDKLEDDDDE